MANTEKYEENDCVRHNPQSWITVIHVLVNAVSYYEKSILCSLDYSYILIIWYWLFLHIIR